MPHFINHNLKVAKFRSKEICFFFFSKHVYIWYSTSRGDDVMVKRKPQYVKIKEYIIQNIEDEKLIIDCVDNFYMSNKFELASIVTLNNKVIESQVWLGV